MIKGTQHEFGNEWDVYRDILPAHREQFLRWIGGMGLDAFKGKSFIDAGCGIGRNALWPLQAGALEGLCFDYDERTVAVARRNLRDHPNCRVELMSIYDLDVENAYDIAFSIGVIHHLAEPKRAVERLVAALKPGGTLILWVYGQEGNEFYLRYLHPVRQAITSRIPFWLTRWLAWGLTPLLKLWLMLPQRNEYGRFLRTLTRRHLEAIVVDQLLPSIANYWTRDEVYELIEGLPVELVRMVHTNGMSWTIIARKVAPPSSAAS